METTELSSKKGTGSSYPMHIHNINYYRQRYFYRSIKYIGKYFIT